MKAITFSFDDGSHNDIRVGDILSKYGMKATFYITCNKLIEGDLTKDYIDRLRPHEIGSHLVDHVDMLSISDDEVEYQLCQSKEILDNINSKNIDLFSYPWGNYDISKMEIYKHCNYISARTTEEIGIYSFKDITPFEMPISSFIEHESVDSIKSLVLNLLKTDGILHLCGHSWKFGDDESDVYTYEEFEKLISTIANIPYIEYLSNGEVIELHNREYWNRIAHTYRKQYWSNDVDYMNKIIEAGTFNSSHSVLDAGTGHGAVVDAVAPIVKSVNAVDISPVMISEAMANNKYNNVFYSIGNLEKLEFHDNTFDRIILRLVLHHLVDTYDSVLSELYRILKPGGIILISEGLPPNENVREKYKEIFSLKENRITFKDGQIESMMSPYFTDITTVEYIMHNVSTKYWLENSDMLEKNIDRILQLHINSDDMFKKSYNMKVTDDPIDAIVDWRFLIITGCKNNGQ